MVQIANMTNQQIYDVFIEIAKTSEPGQLRRDVSERLSICYSTISRTLKKLRDAGFDLTPWELKAKHNHVVTGRVYKSPNITDKVVLRRIQWLADMKALASNADPYNDLAILWNTTREIVHGRLYILRGAGYDLSWWCLNPSPAFGDAEQVAAALLEKRKRNKPDKSEISLDEEPEKKLEKVTATKPVETPVPLIPVEPVKSDNCSGQKPELLLPFTRINYPKAEIGYTIQSIAEIAGVSVIQARFAAKELGVPFGTFVVTREIALKVLASLGFYPVAA